jgi:hypothetical protein
MPYQQLLQKRCPYHRRTLQMPKSETFKYARALNLAHFHPNFTQIPIQASFGTSQPNSSNGRSLPSALCNKMERAFNTSFANVQVYESSHASSIGALAYTQGNHIYFAQGKFRPDTFSGQVLLGHELAHVVQQRQGRVKPNTSVNGLPINDNPALEQEADELGYRAAQLR